MSGRAEFRPGGPYLGMSHARVVLAERLQRFIVAECADLECPHGWLVSDGARCGCFGAEVTQLPKRKAVERKAA